MELRLDPEIPVTRVVNGHNVFNKGYHHGLRGKTYEEYYGKERAVEIRKRHSEALKGHRYWSNGNAHAFACIAITPEGKWYRFDSITQAAQKLIVETFVLIFALPCVYKDFMNLWKEK